MLDELAQAPRDDQLLFVRERLAAVPEDDLVAGQVRRVRQRHRTRGHEQVGETQRVEHLADVVERAADDEQVRADELAQGIALASRASPQLRADVVGGLLVRRARLADP